MSYEIFVEQLTEAESAFPKLKRKLTDHGYVLAGELDVIDANERLWETFQIEIRYQEGFPHCFPSLYETGDKIPKIADWHIYEDTLSCCVKVKPAEIIRCVGGITISEYIKEEALPYFFNQAYRRLEGYYVNGEYAHGLAGIYQFYAEELRTFNDYEKTIRMMRFIATNERPERTALCFCKSGVKFRNCHREAFDKLKQIGNHDLVAHCYDIGKATGVIK